MPRSTRGKRAASGPSSSYPDNIRELREEDFKQVSDRTSRLRMQDPYLYQNRSVSRQPDRQERSYYERERTSNAHKAQTARPAAGRSTSRQKTAPQRTQNVGRRTGAILTKQKSRPKRPWETMILPKRKESNFQLISCVVILLLFGLIMVTSSSYYYAYTALGDSMYFFRRQAMWIVVGLLTMFIFAHIPIKWLSRFAWAVYFIALFFQLAVLFVGTEVNGSTRWIQVGPVNFQPSELSKLAMAIIMAYLVEIHKGEIGRLRTFLKLLCVLGLPTILVAVENLSSAVIIAFIGLLIMYIGGCKPRHFIGIVLPLAAILILLIWLPLLVPVESMPSGLGKSLAGSIQICAGRRVPDGPVPVCGWVRRLFRPGAWAEHPETGLYPRSLQRHYFCHYLRRTGLVRSLCGHYDLCYVCLERHPHQSVRPRPLHFSSGSRPGRPDRPAGDPQHRGQYQFDPADRCVPSFYQLRRFVNVLFDGKCRYPSGYFRLQPSDRHEGSVKVSAGS